MNKAEIIAQMAKETKTTLYAAGKAFEAFIGSIKESLKKGDKVSFTGFGTFSVAEKKARKGRNPQTGKEIKIAAKKVPKFTAGKTLKAVVNADAPKTKKAPAKKVSASKKK